MNYLQPCLLFILTKDDIHGYSLLDQLQEFGFDRQQLDPSLVYRALRNMAEAGLVDSQWDDDSQGPRRRMYRILPEGEAHLAAWIDDLRRTRAEIDRLLQAYDRKDDVSAKEANMPGRDGTGPEGKGSKTGRGVGNCAGAASPTNSRRRPGRGARGFRRGRGWRRGRRRGLEGVTPEQETRTSGE